jgi:hypothetical protein
MPHRVPLVRVEGKTFAVRPELSMTPARFGMAAMLEREARDHVARDAEQEYGFVASLYFFAGVAHPAFGDVVLAYDPEPSERLEGGATTFDTGGMYLGKIKGNAFATPKLRKKFVKQDCCTLAQWRARVDEWIDAHFETPDHYVDGFPDANADDPSGRIGHPENERRAWTCEVRLGRDQPLLDNLAFAVVRREFWQDALHTAQHSSARYERLLDLQEQGRIHVVDLSSDSCTSASSWIKRYIAEAGGVA